MPGRTSWPHPSITQSTGEAYYALFFKDPCGIKLEVVFEPRA
jgi:hypothetical protein